MLGEPAEEAHWKKVGLKPLCLRLQLGQLVRFVSLLLSSHKSGLNTSSSSVRDRYQTLHNSRHGKTVNDQCQGCFLKQRHEWPGHLLASKWPAANYTICLNQIPLGACGDQFHTQWVLYPTQPKSYFHTHFEPWLLCRRQYRIRSFLPLVFLGNQPARLWKKKSILDLFVQLCYDLKDMGLISYSFQFTLMLLQCLMYILIQFTVG